MLNKTNIKKAIYWFSIVLLHTSCNAANKNIYRIFNAELTKTILTITIENNSTINIKGAYKNTGDSIDYTAVLTKLTNNFYCFNSYDKTGKCKGLTLVEIMPDEQLMLLYDSCFSNKKNIEIFLKDNVNTISAAGIYISEGISLEQVRNFPPVKDMQQKDVNALQKLRINRLKKLLTIEEKLTNGRAKAELFFREASWLLAQCQLMHYKPPQNKAEWDLLNKDPMLQEIKSNKDDLTGQVWKLQSVNKKLYGMQYAFIDNKHVKVTAWFSYSGYYTNNTEEIYHYNPATNEIYFTVDKVIVQEYPNAPNTNADKSAGKKYAIKIGKQLNSDTYEITIHKDYTIDNGENYIIGKPSMAHQFVQLVKVQQQ